MYLFLFLLTLFYCITNVLCNHQFHSCVGYCNSNLFVENSCFCNDDCMHKNNCCFNFLMVCSSESSNSTTHKAINATMNSIFNNTLNNTFNNTFNNLNEEESYYLRKNTSNNIYEKSFYLNIFLLIVLFNLYMYLKTRNY